MTVSDGDYQPRKRHYEKEPDTLELDSVITKVKNSAQGLTVNMNLQKKKKSAKQKQIGRDYER